MSYTACLAAIQLSDRDWTFVSAAVFMCLVGFGLVAFRKRLKTGNFFPFLFLTITLIFAAFVGFGILLGKTFK